MLYIQSEAGPGLLGVLASGHLTFRIPGPASRVRSSFFPSLPPSHSSENQWKKYLRHPHVRIKSKNTLMSSFGGQCLFSQCQSSNQNYFSLTSHLWTHQLSFPVPHAQCPYSVLCLVSSAWCPAYGSFKSPVNMEKSVLHPFSCLTFSKCP